MKLKIITRALTENCTTVHLKGSLDTTTSLKLADQIETLIAPLPKTLVINMTDLDYISSAGLRVILKTRKALLPESDLLLANLQPRVKAVFAIINALPSEVFFESMQSALAHHENNL